MTSRTRSGTACPRCDSASVPIVYGTPSGELFDAADRGVDCGIQF